MTLIVADLPREILEQQASQLATSTDRSTVRKARPQVRQEFTFARLPFTVAYPVLQEILSFSAVVHQAQMEMEDGVR